MENIIDEFRQADFNPDELTQAVAMSVLDFVLDMPLSDRARFIFDAAEIGTLLTLVMNGDPDTYQAIGEATTDLAGKLGLIIDDDGEAGITRVIRDWED